MTALLSPVSLAMLLMKSDLQVLPTTSAEDGTIWRDELGVLRTDGERELVAKPLNIPVSINDYIAADGSYKSIPAVNSSAIQSALGFLPLSPNLNLSELTSAATARTNLGAAADSAVVHINGNESIAGVKSFGTSNPTVIGGSAGRGGYIDFSVGGTTAGLSLGGLNRIFPNVSGTISDNLLALGRADYRFSEIHVNAVMAGTVTASGDLIINRAGSGAPTIEFTNGTGGTLKLSSDSSRNFQLTDITGAGTNRFYIQASTGRVGIGNYYGGVEPPSKLSVQGEVNATAFRNTNGSAYRPDVTSYVDIGSGGIEFRAIGTGYPTVFSVSEAGAITASTTLKLTESSLVIGQRDIGWPASGAIANISGNSIKLYSNTGVDILNNGGTAFSGLSVGGITASGEIRYNGPTEMVRLLSAATGYGGISFDVNNAIPGLDTIALWGSADANATVLNAKTTLYLRANNTTVGLIQSTGLDITGTLTVSDTAIANNGVRVGPGYSAIEAATGSTGLYLGGSQGGLHWLINSSGNLVDQGTHSITVGGAIESTYSSAALGYHTRFSGTIAASTFGVYLNSVGSGDGAMAYYSNLGTITGGCTGYLAVAAATGGINNTLRNTNGAAYNLIWSSANHDAFTYHVAGVRECSFGLDYSETQFRVSQSSDLDTPRLTLDLASGNTWVQGGFTSGQTGASNGSFQANAVNTNAYAKMYGATSDAFVKLNSSGNGNYRGIRFGYGASTEDWLFGYFGGLTAGDLGLYGPVANHVFKADGSTEFGGAITATGQHVFNSGVLTPTGTVTTFQTINATGGFSEWRFRHQVSAGGDASIYLGNDTVNKWIRPSAGSFLIKNAGLSTIASFNNDLSTEFAGSIISTGRMVLRDDGVQSSGLWLQKSAANGNAAFIGLLTDTVSGLFSIDASSWIQTTNLTNGDFQIQGLLSCYGSILEVGTPSIRDTRWNRSGAGIAKLQTYNGSIWIDNLVMNSDGSTEVAVKSSTLDPTALDITAGAVKAWHNTISGDTSISANIGGIIKKVLLT